MAEKQYVGPFRVYAAETEDEDLKAIGTYADLDEACRVAESIVAEGWAEAKVRDVPTYVTVQHVTN